MLITLEPIKSFFAFVRNQRSFIKADPGNFSTGTVPKSINRTKSEIH
jgi:hypothetical protein